MEKLMEDWIHLIEPSRKQLLQSRELLRQLRSLRKPEDPPSAQEQQLESLINQLVTACQQTEAQFSVIQEATKERDRAAHELNLEKLILSLNGWSSFLSLGLVERKDFLRQWLSSIGIHRDIQDPALIESLGIWPKNLSACRTWERHLILPRKISSMMEIGSAFGVNAIYLARMLRMSASESRASMIKLAKNLQSAHLLAGCQPPVDFNCGSFQPNSANSLPVDSFDAIWFHRQAWSQWTKQDGPLLFSGLGELANRAHFLLFTTTEKEVPRSDLLRSFYDLILAGERNEGSETFRYFIAQRRFITVSEKRFRCFDIRLHDCTWQGRETLNHGSALLPWIQPTIALPTRRFILGEGVVLHSFLKRTPHTKIAKIQHQELMMWQSVSNQIPELPQLLGASEDAVGYHLLLGLRAMTAEFPSLPLPKEKQRIILRSALRLLFFLRKRSLHLNFLRLGNFVLTGDHATFLSAGLMSYDEVEEPLDALLWLLRDLNADILYWHDLPIEPFRAESVSTLAEEYQGIAALALKSKNIDAFLTHPLIQQEFL